MDKSPVTVVLFVAIIVHQGLNHQGIELLASQETPILSPALLEAVRVVDADIHNHQETPGGLDQLQGRSIEAVVTTGTRPFVTPMDGNEFRRHRPNGQFYDQQQMPLTLRALSVIR